MTKRKCSSRERLSIIRRTLCHFHNEKAFKFSSNYFQIKFQDKMFDFFTNWKSFSKKASYNLLSQFRRSQGKYEANINQISLTTILVIIKVFNISIFEIISQSQLCFTFTESFNSRLERNTKIVSDISWRR